MNNFPKNGLGTMAQALMELEELLPLIPLEYRGLRFERVLESCHPQEVTRRLELAFAIEWAERNRGTSHALYTLLTADEDDPRKSSAPCTVREWEVVELAIATMVRWLPTAIGTSFLQAAFGRAGGSLSYILPDITKEMPPLPLPRDPVEEVSGGIEDDGSSEMGDNEDDWPIA